MSDSTPEITTESVTASLLCRTCGYDLRGLAIEAKCPECGAPVSQALKEDTIENAHPDWLKKLFLGCRLYTFGTIVSLVVMFSMMIVSILIGIFAGAQGDPRAVQSSGIQVIASIFGFSATLIALVGAWLITERNPAEHDDSLGKSRGMARAGLIVYLVLSPWGMYSGMGAGSSAAPTVPSAFVTIVIAVVGLVMTAAAVMGWFAYYHYFSALLRRLPSKSLAAQGRVVRWGYSIAVGVMFLGVVGVMVLQQRGVAPGQNLSPVVIVFIIAGLMSCVGVFAFWTFEIWGLILHMILGRRLRAFLAPW